jgi:hypothetical protein
VPQGRVQARDLLLAGRHLPRPRKIVSSRPSRGSMLHTTLKTI